MMENEMIDDGEAWCPLMMKEVYFRQLFAALRTMYAVSVQKVSKGHDPGSFQGAKQLLTTFVARSSGWTVRAGFKAKQRLHREARDGSGQRRGVHEAHDDEEQERRTGGGDDASLGGRGCGLRSKLPGAPARCPTCQAEKPMRLWRQCDRVVCTKCHRKGGQ